MIPKVIHYCWFGGKPLPRDARKCIDSWKRHCPDYKIVRWDESNFDVGCHPFCKAAYEAKAWAFVSDYARLKIIYDNGGNYFDTDVEVLRNLDDLLNCNCYFGIEQVVLLCNTGLGFGAKKGNRVVGDMLDLYDTIAFDQNRTKEIACPYLNNEVLVQHGYQHIDSVVDINGIRVYPPRYFDPIAPSRSSENLLCDETFSIHRYSNSWGTSRQKMRRKIIGLLGLERIARIKEMLHG
ncbi:glycosyltransferase family 32 protein [Collinsella ihumii]|uniref:glycosyltransferase family 32 protein n=1 Tax=Collinsella ihumii TaxID=1720204 RepID=UPI0009AEA38B|nr:glycosyltransferase [Collinsella ihumii]